MCLCFGYTNSLIYQSLNDVVLCRGVKSRVHSKNILITVTNRIPVTKTPGRVNEALRWNLLTKYWDEGE